MSTKQKFTLHRALVEIKNLQRKVDGNVFNSLEFSGVVKKTTGKTKKNVSRVELEKNCQTNFQTSDATYKNLMRLKTAVAETNQKTYLRDTINGESFTIQQAIFAKEMYGKQLIFLNGVKNSILRSENEVVKSSDDVEKQIGDFLKSAEAKDLTAEQIEKRKELIRENLEMELISFTKQPKEYLESEIEKLNNFLSQVDEQLSIINSLTEIEIDFV
jgi:hypothetical protein